MSATRREVLQGAGFLALSFNLPRALLAAEGEGLPNDLAHNKRLDMWLRIAADGAVSLRTGKVEIGQGINISLKKIATLQLGVNAAQLEFIAGDTAICPDEWYTAGSQSIEVGGHSLAFACQHFKAFFAAAAAKKLSCKVGSGITIHSNPEKEYEECEAKIEAIRNIPVS